jgi:hypothetical protein
VTPLDAPSTPPSADARAFDRSLLAAVALLCAAGIHAAAAVGHAEHGATHVAMFVAAAAIEAGAAVALARRARLALVGAAAVSVALIAVWLRSRTTGILGDPAETVGAPDLVVAALHALVVLAAALPEAMVWRTNPRQSPPHAGLVAIAALAVLSVPAAVAAYDGDAAAHGHGAAETASSEVVGDDGHGHAGEAASAAATDGHDQGHAEDGLAASVGGIHVHGDTECAPTAQQQADADEFVATVSATLATTYPTIEAATSAGYQPLGTSGAGGRRSERGLNGTWHYVNESLYGDGRVLDPTAPESIIYGRTMNGSIEPIGVMFQLDAPDDIGPQPFGCVAAWHSHDESVVEGEMASIPMLHAWTVELPGGPFDHQGSPSYACTYLGEVGVARGYVVEPPSCTAREATNAEVIDALRANRAAS